MKSWHDEDPKMLLEVIPSPGTQDREWEVIERKIESVKGFVKTIHVDIADGIFTPNKTFADPKPFRKYADDLFLEVHLMTDDPIKHLKTWADAGFRRFIGHVEKMSDQVEFVAQGQLLGEVGLAIDGPTPLDAVTVPFEDLDCVLFYTSDRAGYSGKPFMPDRLEKVRALREKHPYLPIEADGGINQKTIHEAVQSGITRFIGTSAFFNTDDPKKAYEELEAILSPFNALAEASRKEG